MNSSNFKLPDTYYDPPEKLLWFINCSECCWTSEEGYDNQCEIPFIECCPECKSTAIFNESEWV